MSARWFRIALLMLIAIAVSVPEASIRSTRVRAQGRRQLMTIPANAATASNVKLDQSAAETKPPVFDLDTYQFGLLRRGPKWTAESTPETQKIQAGHMENIGKMASSGKLMAAGPMMDSGDLRGIFVFKADSIDEAAKLAAEDPALKSGRLALDLLTWVAPRGIGSKFNEEYRKDPTTKTTMKKYHLVFLKSPATGGPATPPTTQLQNDHLWSIRRMLDSGKLAAAGPFGGSKDLKGIFVFATESMDEAKAWADADPAVKAGVYTVEIHPWFVAKEVWPNPVK